MKFYQNGAGLSGLKNVDGRPRVCGSKPMQSTRIEIMMIINEMVITTFSNGLTLRATTIGSGI